MSALSIDSLNQLQLQTQTLIGKSVAVLGITGSGKTNTAAVLIEELLASDLPLTIIDIEGEYWGLKERFEILVAGHSEHAELEVNIANASRLADIAVKRGISIILDLSDFTQEAATEVLKEYFTGLWSASSSTRHPYQIVLEEAHEFVPQGASSELKQMLTRIALRGRKRGLGIILISQRSAKVEKDVLTQASLLFLHKVVHPIDMKVYKDLIPLPANRVEELVRRLQPGEAIVLHNHQVDTIQLRLRYTFHAGATPALNSSIEPQLRKLDETILKELRDLLTNVNPREMGNSKQAELTQRIKELEEVIARKDAEIERLQNQVDLLSKLKVLIEGLPSGGQFSPKTLELDKAVVRQVVAGERADGIIGRSAATISEVPQSELSLSSAEQRKLDSLIRRVQKLPRLQRSILRLLVEHEGASMTVPMIATWLSLKESTVRSRPPHDLLRMRLITRTRSSRGYRYTSQLQAYLKAEFPRADATGLLKQIFQ